MSDTTAPDTADSSGDKPADSAATTATTTTATTAQNNKPMKKVKSKKDLKDPTDPARFENPGVNFNAKLIGIDDIESARGDKMCQEAMGRLKIAVKTSGQHKQKIVINVSLEGIKIMDVRTQAVNHTHAVHRISFISRDVTDARAFGYVYGAGEGKHKFFAIKTEKAAEALVLALRDLFQAVYQMKKKEVEDAKNKKEEEPVENAEEAKNEEEPVYQVPNNKPVENGTDPTYQVPGNNAPVEGQQQTTDLLNLENELETIERRIEQIDTMEELFKELEAPPTTQASVKPTGSSWANDLAGLSQPQTQPQPMFSMGGNPFPNNQQFQPQPNPQAPFANQPFGMPGQQGPFGFQQQQQPAPGAPVMGGPFGASPNAFQAPPSVPPRTGMGFAGQPAAFPGQPGGFPGTPFPGVQQQTPTFPGAPGPQPSVQITPVNDPFGADPFASNDTFEESILTPARTETPVEAAPAQSTKADVFGDLVAIGDKGTQKKSPKEMFTDLAAPARVSLNELKVKPPSPKPASPVGFQASEDLGKSSSSSFNSQPMPSSDPFGSSNNPFGNKDPFASDPFASTASISQTAVSAQNTHTTQPDISHDALFGGNVFGGEDFNIPLPVGPPPPLPNGPPPPLPKDIANHLQIESQIGPILPPRPSVKPHHTPPLPPRPRSTNSDSNKSSNGSLTSLNSLTESQTVNQQQIPTLPPRPKAAASSIAAVPRPRPRAALPNGALNINLENKDKADSFGVQSKNKVLNKTDKLEFVKSDSANVNKSSDKSTKSNKQVQELVPTSRLNHSAKIENSKLKESQNESCSNVQQDSGRKSTTSESSNSSLRTLSSASSVPDPFVSTDPFASYDPFVQTDPFANDPFAPDPFSDPAFTSNHQSAGTQPAGSGDPFTSVVVSPKSSRDDTDPFSVFDKTFSSDSFKFDRSSSKKSKLKVSGQ